MKPLHTLLLLMLIGFSSCESFLKEVPTNAVFMDNIDDIKKAISTYLLAYKTNVTLADTDAPSPWMGHQFGMLINQYGDIWNFTEWNSYSSLTETQKRTLDRTIVDIGFWRVHYAIIAYTTLVITPGLVSKGDKSMRDYVLGEAFVHRAYSFFKLLQYYAPVDEPRLGVPVFLDIYQDFRKADLSRKPQSEVYQQIFDDLFSALECLERTPPRESFNVAYNYDYVYRILSQVYLWKAHSGASEPTDWEKAGEYAQKAIDAVYGALPYTLPELATQCFMAKADAVSPARYYPEALYYCAATLPNYSFYSWGYDIDLWKTLYDENDLRKKQWFLSEYHQQLPTAQIQQSDLSPHLVKITAGLNKYPTVLFRLAEQYLILIEALAHTNFGLAKEKLKLWQSVRYSGPENDWFVPSSADELIEWMYNERKREFVLEGDIIWLDMKRFKKSDKRGALSFEYTLEPDDFRYQFRIPDSELEKNRTIEKNPGWDNLGDY